MSEGSIINKMTVEDTDLKGKRVFIRVDFNVPLDENLVITDDRRIRGALPTINYCIDEGAKVILADPRGAQPVYEPAPRVRGEIIDQYPEIANILDPVFESLDLETLQTLNARITVEGQNATDVASEYLTSMGFLK